MTLPLLAAVLGVAVGYLAGRCSIGTRLLDWAEDQCTGPLWRPRFLAAVPILLVAIAAAWILHPKQTAANRRSWREQQALLAPVPSYDPGRTQRRSGGL
ncbi:hypothetical protein [Streptomyces smyrnaeus]|uniref:hypothetical protein n=1 Tax=Streptomyces smyrnaeus TaxID=1387713 RepID=UPI00367A9966